MATYKGTALRNDLKELIMESPMLSLNFQADTILPTKSVTEVSGLIPVLSTSAGMKQLDLKRAKRGTFQRAEWVWGNDSFATYEYGYEEPVDNVEAIINRDIFNEEVVAGQIAESQLKLAREKRVADAVFNTTNFTGAANTLTLTNEWDDATNADPFDDINDAHDKIFAKTGRPRSDMSLIINDIVFRNVLRADKVRNDVKYTSAIDTMSQATKLQFFADFLGIKEIIIVTSFTDTTKLGVEAASFSRLWSNEYAMLCLRSLGVDSWRIPGLGRQPVYTPYSSDFRVESYDEEQSDSRIIRVREYRGEYINSVFGVLIDNVTT